MSKQISKDQGNSAGLSDREMFIDQLTKDVIEENPNLPKFWPENFIRYMVGYGVDRATIAHQFVRDQDVSLFVSLMFSTGPDFDQNPRILGVLRDTSLTMDERWLKVSEDTEYAEDWAEANELDHQDNWFVEGRGNIKDAYPTTYMESGFITLYEKVRGERYPELAPGESLR